METIKNFDGYVVKIVPYNEKMAEIFKERQKKYQDEYQRKKREDFQTYLDWYGKVISDKLIEGNGRTYGIEITKDEADRNYSEGIIKKLHFSYNWETAIEAVKILLEEYRKEGYSILTSKFSPGYYIKLRFWVTMV